MSVLSTLHDEHRLTRLMLERLRQASQNQDPTSMAEVLVFLDDVVESLHHAKEEQVLFPALRKAGLAPAIIGGLSAEHERLTRHVRTIRAHEEQAKRGDLASRSIMAEEIASYQRLSLLHLRREEQTVYALAEQSLGPGQLADVEAKADALTARLLGEDRYAWLVSRANSTPGTGPSKATTPAPGEVVSARSLLPWARDSAEPNRCPETEVIHDSRAHTVAVIRDAQNGLSLGSNQYVIAHGGQGLIVDPGGPKVYPEVFRRTTSILDSKRDQRASLRYLFFSHQDPDVCTSLNSWLIDSSADALISQLWLRFLPHFGLDGLLSRRLRPIPDEGMVIDLGGESLWAVPAHFLHSPGNFQLFDPVSKILFTGDLGSSEDYGTSAAVDPAERMLSFHQRFMASRAAVTRWVAIARRLDIETIAPQHGSLILGRDAVQNFLTFCESTPCGADLLGELIPPRLRSTPQL
ncbi:MAG: hemerythrin domain-containing protein, partial [Deltaproteobacteria bacterium]|nr:hemerythrin domain-containing protein [Deltaproteobacteria bacterium]